jgi:uncharacterized protein (TIGR01777 family)
MSFNQERIHKILITGASGLIGGELIPTLEAKGHEIYKLSRKAAKGAKEIQWDAELGFSESEQAKLENFDAVVHMVGENVAGGSWTEEKKRRIRDSRVVGTRTLVDAFKKTKDPPKIFVSASAIGFYGDRGDEPVDEKSAPGKGFLAEMCAEWEAESKKANDFGARVVMPRIGIVLTKDGGALGKMVTPFKFGLGGKMGSGKHWMSWIAIDDLIRIVHFALENEDLQGAINASAPNPVTNEEFTKTLGKVLHRPTFFTMPEFAIKLMFGEMGETLLLEGQRVLPKKLQDAGFEFKFENLEDAFKNVLE